VALAVPTLVDPAPPAALPRELPRRKPRQCVSTPVLSTIIVNYRHWQDTGRLVHELSTTPAVRSGAAEVVIVDNHSPPDRIAHRLRRLPYVSLRRWGHNRGFARAVNEGCRLSQGQWFLLLNPDVSLTDDFIEKALRLAQHLDAQEPRTGIVGFKLRNCDGSRQLSSGPFPTLASTLAGLFMPRAKRKYRRVHGRRRCKVPWVTGCCMLVKRACFQQLGGFQRDFFLYYEDVDFCQRAREHGWHVCYEPNLRAVHHHPLHSRRVSAPMRLLVRHALLTYAQKHWPCWQFRVLSGIVGVEASVRCRLARWKGNNVAACVFTELTAMTRDLLRNDQAGARQRLRRVLRHEESIRSARTCDM
jgi:GT2 family glycosyltransferase